MYDYSYESGINTVKNLINVPLMYVNAQLSLLVVLEIE